MFGCLCGNSHGLSCQKLLTGVNPLCLTGADEEYIYMNKVIVTGKDKDEKGVSFTRFLSFKHFLP